MNSVTLPNWSNLLHEAVNKPGLIMQAYNAFHRYSQTEGEEMPPVEIPRFDADLALSTLDIRRVAFDEPDGNCQGFARRREIAVSPIAELPHKTFFHELAHVVLGHILS